MDFFSKCFTLFPPIQFGFKQINTWTEQFYFHFISPMSCSGLTYYSISIPPAAEYTVQVTPAYFENPVTGLCITHGIWSLRKQIGFSAIRTKHKSSLDVYVGLPERRTSVSPRKLTPKELLNEVTENNQGRHKAAQLIVEMKSLTAR